MQVQIAARHGRDGLKILAAEPQGKAVIFGSR